MAGWLWFWLVLPEFEDLLPELTCLLISVLKVSEFRFLVILSEICWLVLDLVCGIAFVLFFFEVTS